ncbi:hypothetical protein HN873_051374 [Arachis hypogaea]
MPSFAHLRFLSLRNNTKIQRLPASICKLLNLQSLLLDGCTKLECDKLESLFVGRKLPNLRTLEVDSCERLVINKCGDLEFSEELVETLPSCFQGSASTLETLAIKECIRLESLPEWLSTPSSLKSLQITNCPNLKSLPSNLHRPAIKSFQISDYPRLQKM